MTGLYPCRGCTPAFKPLSADLNALAGIITIDLVQHLDVEQVPVASSMRVQIAPIGRVLDAAGLRDCGSNQS